MITFSRRLALFSSASLWFANQVCVAQRGEVFPEEFGARGDGKADDSAAINAADLEAARLGRTLRFTRTYRTIEQLLMSSNWHFDGGQIVRDWIGMHNPGQKEQSATICGRGNDPLSSFYVDPGPYRPTGMLRDLALTGNGDIRMSRAARAYYDANSGSHATMLYMLCDNFRIGEGMRFALGGNDWCIAFGGNGFVGEPFHIYWQSEASRLYEDGFHVLFGRRGRGWGWQIESGDDSISFSNTLNLGISDWRVHDPRVFSQCVFGIKIASQRVGVTGRFGSVTEPIENVHILRPRWIDPRERPSRNGFVYINSVGDKSGIIRNCSVTDGIFRGQVNGLPRGFENGVPGVSIEGPVANSRVEAEVHNPSLWAARMWPDHAGRMPSESLIEVDVHGRYNWTRARNIEIFDRRGIGSDSDIQRRPQ